VVGVAPWPRCLSVGGSQKQGLKVRTLWGGVSVASLALEPLTGYAFCSSGFASVCRAVSDWSHVKEEKKKMAEVPLEKV